MKDLKPKVLFKLVRTAAHFPCKSCN